MKYSPSTVLTGRYSSVCLRMKLWLHGLWDQQAGYNALQYFSSLESGTSIAAAQLRE